ncbi:hypothetical protein E4U43_007064 [Claviceps pusilla]|uniref:Uncharacterized protein n=1 Tax=Claviceps pusilla TaxID=123648 RepID=A0A9P7NHM8_9HYPO|nr:hypothetical protein E4U43_007064 [Claviceps pusilla]
MYNMNLRHGVRMQLSGQTSGRGELLSVAIATDFYGLKLPIHVFSGDLQSRDKPIVYQFQSRQDKTGE